MAQDRTSGRVPPPASPKSHKQGYNDRLDESLGAKDRGRKSSQSWKKVPVSLDVNYRRRLSPVTDNIRKEYKKWVTNYMELAV